MLDNAQNLSDSTGPIGGLTILIDAFVQLRMNTKKARSIVGRAF